MDWQTITDTGNDVTERLAVPGGWLYRSAFTHGPRALGTDPLSGAAMAFVAGPSDYVEPPKQDEPETPVDDDVQPTAITGAGPLDPVRPTVVGERHQVGELHQSATEPPVSGEGARYPTPAPEEKPADDKKADAKPPVTDKADHHEEAHEDKGKDDHGKVVVAGIKGPKRK